MRRLILTLLVICALFGVAWADGLYVVGDETLSISTSATSLKSIPNTTEAALICTYGSSVRWRGYATSPTSTVGAILDEGDCLYLDSRDQVKNWRVIVKSGGTSATAYIVYYGTP